MDPPSYEEAGLHPPAPAAFNVPPPPSYDATLHSRSSPPPTYGEAVTTQSDRFPVVTSQSRGSIIHATTQIGVTSTQPAVVVTTQPQPVPISVTRLEDVPGVVRCPHCHHVVTSNVTFQAGRAAWCTCVLLMLMGLVCGFCLIPLMIKGLQDAHHSCPRCESKLHVYTR